MRDLRRIRRTLRHLTIAAACWAAVAASALAATPKAIPAQESGGAGWVVSYFLVILGLALGLIFVLRPSKRRERARPEQFGDK